MGQWHLYANMSTALTNGGMAAELSPEAASAGGNYRVVHASTKYNSSHSGIDSRLVFHGPAAARCLAQHRHAAADSGDAQPTCCHLFA